MGAQDQPVRARPATFHERRTRAGDLVNPGAVGVIGVGYESRTVEELVAQLVAMDVSRL